MAIKKTFKLEQDNTIEIPNAYYRIDEIYGTKNKLSMKVSTYTSKENAIPGKQLSSKSYVFIPSLLEGSDNFIKQGYLFLMSLDEFIDGINDEGQDLEEDPIVEPPPEEEVL